MSDDTSADRPVMVSGSEHADKNCYHTQFCGSVTQMASTKHISKAEAESQGRIKCSRCDSLDREYQPPEGDVDGAATPDDSRIECCPECKSGRFCVRGSAIEDNPMRSDKRYYCKECTHDFDEPATKRGQKQVPRRGLAADLIDADPEEVSR